MANFKMTGSFPAFDPSGKRRRIDVLTSVTEFHNALTDSPSVDTELQSDDGEAVERLEKGRYRLRASGIELTSNDPTAL